MKTQQLEKFNIIGISVRTSNNGHADKDIPALWKRFMEEDISSKIANKIEDAIYCAYTEYESDHTKPYTTLIGCKVDSLDNIPDGMKGITIDASNYSKFVAKGDLMEGAVVNTWFKIWEAPLDRTYKTDFEVYGSKAQNPNDAEVDIFVGVK
ncbi:bacterial regulatory protein, DeoR family [hydrothermal vent metagenome]|uniref:Bacterial regulatory protein, DeoR family n=1 Tax=hydrothermal vent metagenome TaxID=652676 RepID=A0A3B0U942_9ZZZZ